MTVASTTMYVEGFQREFTSYTVEVRDPRVDRDAGTLSVDVFSGERDGTSAIVNNATYTMTIGGETVVDGEERPFSGTSSSLGKSTTLTGDVDVSRSEVDVSVTIAPVGEPGDETLYFTVEIPPPEPDPALVTTTDCSSGGEVDVGEETTVDVTLRNDNPVTAPVTVTIAAGGATAEKRVSLSAGGEQTVSATFAFDSKGDYKPTVEVAL